MREMLFRFSLNFDPVKELLKMRRHIFILMKKVIILRKIHVKTSLSLHHSLPLKETKHIHVSAADVLHTVFE